MARVRYEFVTENPDGSAADLGDDLTALGPAGVQWLTRELRRLSPEDVVFRSEPLGWRADEAGEWRALSLQPVVVVCQVRLLPTFTPLPPLMIATVVRVLHNDTCAAFLARGDPAP